jgi:hypothetical protein
MAGNNGMHSKGDRERNRIIHPGPKLWLLSYMEKE